MAYGIDVNAKNLMLDGAWGTGASSGIYAAILTGTAPTDYADAKAKEVTGGTPTYARKQLNWSAASNGTKALAAQPPFDIPPGTTITGVAYWKNANAGQGSAAEYMGSQALQTPETFGGQGIYTLTAENITI